MRVIIDSRTGIVGGTASSLVVEEDAPSYNDLLLRIEQLERELKMANAMREEMWGIVEDVACGTALQCITCGKSKPCLCDK